MKISNPITSLMMIILVIIMTIMLAGEASAGGTAACRRNFRDKRYEKCMNLGSQGAAIAWNLQTNNKSYSTLEIAFTGHMVSSEGWIGWGINPVSANAMVGSRVLIAFRDPSSGSPVVLPFMLDEAVMKQQKLLVSQKLDIDVVGSSVEFSSSGGFVLFAEIRLRSKQTVVNHVWNRGKSVAGYSPGIHGFSADDLRSTMTLEMLSSHPMSKGEKKGSDLQMLKTAHGLLNCVSWGFLLLLGVMTGRYLKQYKTMEGTWFYLHLFFQITTYVLGAAGWATGLKLGQLSPGMQEFHRNLGMTIFALGTVQISAGVCRPKKTHKFRRQWKSYHHFVGYACTIISVVNVFQGIGLMNFPENSKINMKLLYSLVLATLIGACAALEVNSWILFFRSRDDDDHAQTLGNTRADEAHHLGLFHTF